MLRRGIFNSHAHLWGLPLVKNWSDHEQIYLVSTYFRDKYRELSPFHCYLLWF